MLDFPFNEKTGLCLLALSSPHIIYLFVWTQTAAFTRIAKALGVQAFDLFCNLSFLLKFVQVGALVAFASVAFPPFKLEAVTPLQCILAVVGIVAGQTLNMGVYKALGKEGVYYGFKLGKVVPWYDGFPFTIVRHPQYVGCILCIWGVVALLFTPACIQAGLLTIASGWTGFYIITGFIESYC